MVDTQGRLLLNRLIDGPPATSQKVVADVVGTTQTNVSAWSRGISRPGPEFRRTLRIAYGIHEDSWLTADERQLIARAESRIAAAAHTANDFDRPTGTEG